MEKHWKETMFRQQCFLVCPGLEVPVLVSGSVESALQDAHVSDAQVK